MREWLLSLPREVRREIGADVARVQWQWPVGKPLVDGFALVLVHGESEKGAMVLVHGIYKKTQKTPPAAIALARKRMKEGT